MIETRPDPRTAAIITSAIELIKAGWVQGKIAEAENGVEVAPNSYQAVRWCLIGAIEYGYLYNSTNGTVYIPNKELVNRAVQLEVNELDLANWNDSPKRSQEEVIKALENSRKKLVLLLRRKKSRTDGVLDP
jgi:hypothetical protein